jgi:hypothetical protein
MSKWTVCHLQTKGVNYDYGMLIRFNQIYISPRANQSDGFVKNVKLKMKLLDDKGKEVLDKDGKIMVDNFRM